MSENINELAEALSKFQGEVVDAHKDKKGYNYKYADLTGVLEIARPLMEKHGLALTQFPGGSGSAVTLESILMHKSGQWISCPMEMEVQGSGKMSLAQAAGAVITYMRRYAASGILGITQTDNDASTKELTTPEEVSSSYAKKIIPQNAPTYNRITPDQIAHLKSLVNESRINAYVKNNGLARIEDLSQAQYQHMVDRVRSEAKEVG